MTEIRVPIAPGELIDKLTILRLKTEQIRDPDKRKNILHEQAVLDAVAQSQIAASPELTNLWDALYRINKALWHVEDDIRSCEARGDFGEAFIALARKVYITNDERADVKKQINLLLGSAIVEEKSYQSTDPL